MLLRMLFWYLIFAFSLLALGFTECLLHR